MCDTLLMACWRSLIGAQLLVLKDWSCNSIFECYRSKRSNLHLGLARRVQRVNCSNTHVIPELTATDFIWMHDGVLNLFSCSVARTKMQNLDLVRSWILKRHRTRSTYSWQEVHRLLKSPDSHAAGSGHKFYRETHRLSVRVQNFEIDIWPLWDAHGAVGQLTCTWLKTSSPYRTYACSIVSWLTRD